jgi:hypothetical protein
MKTLTVFCSSPSRNDGIEDQTVAWLGSTSPRWSYAMLMSCLSGRQPQPDCIRQGLDHQGRSRGASARWVYDGTKIVDNGGWSKGNGEHSIGQV